jgi:hypothetical protein
MSSPARAFGQANGTAPVPDDVNRAPHPAHSTIST